MQELTSAPWAADFTALRVEEGDDRVVARLDRPEVRNAIDQRLVDELTTLAGELEARPRLLILTGLPTDPATGRKGVFASGADIAQLKERRRDEALAGINSTIFDRLARLPMPMIAALDGYALGGGAELAYAADFRIGTPALRVGQPEPNLGITAGAGATWRLKELVGEPLAKQILLAGRILTGEECLADRIAAQDALAVRLTKAVFHVPRESHPVIDTLAQAILFESDAKFERMQAFLDRKKK
jgi:enoyl-CoA hydratase